MTQSYEQAVLQSALWILSRVFNKGVEKYIENVKVEVEDTTDLLATLYKKDKGEVLKHLKTAIAELETNGITVKVISNIDNKAVFEYGIMK